MYLNGSDDEWTVFRFTNNKINKVFTLGQSKFCSVYSVSTQGQSGMRMNISIFCGNSREVCRGGFQALNCLDGHHSIMNAIVTIILGTQITKVLKHDANFRDFFRPFLTCIG